jgi:hypothetical protein
MCGTSDLSGVLHRPYFVDYNKSTEHNSKGYVHFGLAT